MMKRILAGLLGALLAVAAHASPSLLGPIIGAVTTDRAAYRSGQNAHVLVTLHNTTGGAWSGTVSGTMYGRFVQVDGPSSVAVTALAPGATQAIDLAFSTEAGVDFRGYHIALTATTAGGGVIDTAAAAIDQSSDWGYYPRVCWVAQTYSAYGGTPYRFPPPEASVATLNAWHCNVLLMYDQLFKQHAPHAVGTWTNGDGLTQDQSTILRTVGAAHGLGMGALAYVPIYAAGSTNQTPNYLGDGSGVQLAWGMFTSACAPGCTLANQAGFPANPATTQPLALMDPTNVYWQAYIAAAVKPMLQQYGYDGFFWDTYGAPYGYTPYNAAGAIIDLSTALSGFYNAMKTRLNSRGFVNTVSGWSEADVAANARADFYFSERHPEFGDITNYGQINYLYDTLNNANGRRLPIVLALYMDYVLSQDTACAHYGGAKPCAFNLPGMLYTQASMSAMGVDWAEVADNDRFLGNEGFAVSNQLSASPALLAAMYDYRTFAVANEKLLRDRVTEGYPALTSTITAGGTSSLGAVANAVYALTKTRPGVEVINLLNYSGLSSLNPQDPNSNAPAPPTLGPVTVKTYYAGGLTGAGAGAVGGANRLWWASPDVAHGTPQSLAYSKGSDGNGTFITYTLPSLQYWDMVVLELDGLATSDYAIP